MKIFKITFVCLFVLIGQITFAADHNLQNQRRCHDYGTLVSRNGDIQGKDNPAEYTCYRWEEPRPYSMRDSRYNCCSGWVVLKDPKDYWRSWEYDCGTGEKAYNWDRWDVYCD